MLKGIPPILSPELMKIMMEMGHGDEIIFTDAHFPAASHAQRLVRYDGISIPVLLQAILPFFPLDTYVETPIGLMAVVSGDPVTHSIWDTYRQMLEPHLPTQIEFEFMERYAFYERAKHAFAIVATGECAQYANIILKKGLVNA